ncbi:hypothetical protein LCGC14_1874830, partial [marine sediment metagenome]
TIAVPQADSKQVINVYRGIETDKLFPDESKLKMERTDTGTKLVDIETGEEVILDQKASKGALQKEESAKKVVQQIEPVTADQAIGKTYGLTTSETQGTLDNAEVYYRKLKNIPTDKRTKKQKEDLAFLKRNRKNIEAILDRETKPSSPKPSNKRRMLVLGHDLPNLMGMSDMERRNFMEKITGKRSMKDMVPAQREQVVMAFQQEAKKMGIEHDEADPSPAAVLMSKLRERKQKPSLSRRDARNMKKLRKVLHTMKSGTSFYFLHMARIKRLCRSLDNYEDNGPFMQHIYQPIKNADVKANMSFTKVMEAGIQTMKDLGIDAPAMMTEVKDIGIKDKLSTAERIGIYALAQNDKTMSHLLSEFSEEELGKITRSVEKSENEKLVAAEVQGYFEAGWLEFQAVAKANGITGLVKEENYITAFITDKSDLESTDYLEGLTQQFTEGKFIPGQQHTIERKQNAKRSLELNIFVIHARAAKSLERFKAMAGAASAVGSILKNKGFKRALNDVTYGHGSKVLDGWLKDSIRGKAAYDNSSFAPALRWLRMAGVNFVLGFKVLTAAKQGISFLPAMGVHPGMISNVFANLEQAAIPVKYKEMQAFVYSKSNLVKTRDWNRDLRATYNKKQVRKLYAGKQLSSAAMRMATFIDRHTVVVVWKSAYQLAQKHDMNEEESIRFADGVVEDTQPMGKAVDLPAFFRGSELEKNLTVFQNQVNQNGNMLWYDILGEARSKKINIPMASYRLLMTQIAPALLLGMISRGRPPEDVKEVAKDLMFYLLSPFVFVGRIAYNIVAGDWGPSRMIAETPFIETGRLVTELKKPAKKRKIKRIAKYGARTVG